MWYRYAKARIAAISVDQLWKELDKTPVPGQLGVGDKASFRDLVQGIDPNAISKPDAPAFSDPTGKPDAPAFAEPHPEERTDANDAYRDQRRRQRRKQNLGLDDVVDVEPGSIPIQRPIVDPTDDSIPEEAAVELSEAEQFPEEVETKLEQAAFEQSGLGKLPQVHDGCRCTVRDLGGAYQWLLADSGACPDCQENATKFNGMSNRGL